MWPQNMFSLVPKRLPTISQDWTQQQHGNHTAAVWPRHRWEVNIRMDPQEVGCGGMDWIDLAQDRDRWWALVTAVMKLRVP